MVCEKRLMTALGISENLTEPFCGVVSIIREASMEAAEQERSRRDAGTRVYPDYLGHSHDTRGEAFLSCHIDDIFEAAAKDWRGKVFGKYGLESQGTRVIKLLDDIGSEGQRKIFDRLLPRTELKKLCTQSEELESLEA